MPVPEDKRTEPTTWKATGDACFPQAARIDGRWWVLRVNRWPGPSLYSLLIDAAWHGDLSFDDGLAGGPPDGRQRWEGLPSSPTQSSRTRYGQYETSRRTAASPEIRVTACTASTDPW